MRDRRTRAELDQRAFFFVRFFVDAVLRMPRAELARVVFRFLAFAMMWPPIVANHDEQVYTHFAS